MKYYKIREKRLEKAYKYDQIKKEIRNGTQKKADSNAK